MRLVCYVTYEDEDKQDTSKRDIYLVIQLCKLINHMNEVAPNPFTYREEGKKGVQWSHNTDVSCLSCLGRSRFLRAQIFQPLCLRKKRNLDVLMVHRFAQIRRFVGLRITAICESVRLANLRICESADLRCWSAWLQIWGIGFQGGCHMYGCTCVYDYRCIRMLLPLSLSPSLSFSVFIYIWNMCMHILNPTTVTRDKLTAELCWSVLIPHPFCMSAIVRPRLIQDKVKTRNDDLRTSNFSVMSSTVSRATNRISSWVTSTWDSWNSPRNSRTTDRRLLSCVSKHRLAVMKTTFQNSRWMADRDATTSNVTAPRTTEQYVQTEYNYILHQPAVKKSVTNVESILRNSSKSNCESIQ